MQTPLPEENDVINNTPHSSQEESTTTNSLIESNNSGGDDGDKSSDPSAFISAPSSNMSAESAEEISSSVDDAQKKLMYRQQLRNAAAANARFQQRKSPPNSNMNGGNDYDDTSLSSSNLSPMPQQRVQLISSNSDIKFTERRNKIKAAARSPLIRLQSETSSGGNSEAFMEAALMPPSLPLDHNNMVGRNSNNQVMEDETSNDQSGGTNGHHHPAMKFPTLPQLYSTGSLRGMDLTTSSGGDESSASNENNNKKLHYSPPHRQRGGTGLERGENQKQKSPQLATPSTSVSQQPEADIVKRFRRKMVHKRQRSGDLVAATLMNPGGKDWAGMNRDNIPLPDTPNYDNDDGSSSLLPLPTPDEEKNGDTMMASPLYPYHNGANNTSGERFFSPDSSDLFDFSDSSVSNHNVHLLHQHPPYLHPQQLQQVGYGVDPRQQQQEQQQQQFHHRRHPSGNSHHSSYSGQYSHSGYSGQYNDMTMHDPYGYNPSSMQWYPPNYHDGNSNIPPVYRHRNESEEESGSSYTGSSSSYVTDEDEDASKSTHSSPRSNGEERQHPFSISGHDSNKPSLDINPPEIVMNESRDSKIDTFIQKVTNALDVPLYRTKEQTEISDEKKYPTFVCPNCKTKQRAFLSVATASEQQSSPLAYLALYFAVYMVSSLFVFGLEEGWQPLDCVYFSVITLTTAGLGDFVPTTDGAKIVCACFIYVGVATIGLLLGSLLAGSLDDATKKDAYDAQVKDCPNCQRLERLKARTMSSNPPPMGFPTYYNNTANDGYEEVEETAEQSSATSGSDEPETTQTPAPRRKASHTRHMSLLVNQSPRSQQKKQMLSTVLPPNSALKRNGHTRHMSLGGSLTTPKGGSIPEGLDKIDESTPLMDLKRSEYSKQSNNDKTTRSSEVKFCDESSYSTSSTDSSVLQNPSKPLTRLKAAKYIFLTLNQALANSVFVIAAGSIGFYYIEDMSVVDSFYFTTVLLTSVGYGDIVPVTPAGKIFTTVFIMVAGTILLHNMTLISMIPLELRKRRIEHAVLGQFGNQLTDDELRELSTGTLVNRLKLATNRPDGLDECTREMFSLAMLVRLGRVTEEDVKATFAAFRRLDVGNYGRLNSRTIIEGELMRRRAMSSKKESEWNDHESPANFSQGSYSQGGSVYAPPIPIPQFQFFNYSQQGPMPMYAPTGPGMYGATPMSQFSSSPHTHYSGASHFNFDEYEQWASTWNHYDTLHQTQSH
ncbi:hypothetical protein ACHAWT_004687 [Skeletonema menzelii]